MSPESVPDPTRDSAALAQELQNRISNAVEVIGEFGTFDGEHHKQWVLDQVARHLLGDEYDKWAAPVDEDDHWDVGIAP